MERPSTTKISPPTSSSYSSASELDSPQSDKENRSLFRVNSRDSIATTMGEQESHVLPCNAKKTLGECSITCVDVERPSIQAPPGQPVALSSMADIAQSDTATPRWSGHELLQGVLDNFEDNDLRLKHHLAHRATLSTLFLGASGVVRWLGLSAIENLFQNFHLPSFAANPLAIGVTSLSFLATNLLGVYAVNHMPFEGISSRWQILSGTIALVPAIIDTIAGYVALASLGLGVPVALGGASISFMGNIFYYWNFVDRLPYILQGKNEAKEMLAERAQWLQGEIEKELQCISTQDQEDKAQVCKTLAQRLIRSRRGELIQKLIPICSKSHKARNVIAELKAAQKQSGMESISVEALKTDADQCRVKGCQRAGQLGLLAMFSAVCTGFTWSDNSPSVNSLMQKFYPTMVCATAAQTFYYSACQACSQVFSIAETVSTGVLSLDNAKILKRKVQEGLRNTWRRATKSDVALFIIGLSASCCYTMTIFGAVRKDLQSDPCLGDQEAAQYFIPLVGATAGFLHTWMIGPELKGVKNSVKDLIQNIYRAAKAQYECSRSAERTPLLPSAQPSSKGATSTSLLVNLPTQDEEDPDNLTIQ